ncbi:MAG: radical SAM protein [Neofamilia sp.]
MERYGRIENKDKREIVLLKGYPCVWGKCTFCDYIDDNTVDLDEMVKTNKIILEEVTGEFGKLEVINSGSVFELPPQTLLDIKNKVDEKNIKTIVFEVYYNYRMRLDEIRDFFNGINVEFKTGVETFDEYFRNAVLKKGTIFEDENEVKKYFDVICLLVGMLGQTKEMIEEDIKKSEIFDRVCINIFVDNSTSVRSDPELIAWFKEKYKHLENEDKYDILWNNTDFGVGN